MDAKPSKTPETAGSNQAKRQLSHDEALAWIKQHGVWRKAHKTKPIWARAITPEEVGKEFQTADKAKEKAKEGAWLSVGVADEPWFQKPEQIRRGYDEKESKVIQYKFDDKPYEYHRFVPKAEDLRWAAQISAPDIDGFIIRPGYDRETELYSPSGGYVVRRDRPDPDEDTPDDVWLVQQHLFEATYELLD